jgi:hypothetical protein
MQESLYPRAHGARFGLLADQNAGQTYVLNTRTWNGANDSDSTSEPPRLLI